MPWEEPPHSASALIQIQYIFWFLWHNMAQFGATNSTPLVHRASQLHRQLRGRGRGAAGVHRLGGDSPGAHQRRAGADLPKADRQQSHMQQGRDKLLRQVKVVSPVVTRNVSPTDLASFTSQEMQPAQVPNITQSIHPRLVCCR